MSNLFIKNASENEFFLELNKNLEEVSSFDKNLQDNRLTDAKEHLLIASKLLNELGMKKEAICCEECAKEATCCSGGYSENSGKANQNHTAWQLLEELGEDVSLADDDLNWEDE